MPLGSLSSLQICYPWSLELPELTLGRPILSGEELWVGMCLDCFRVSLGLEGHCEEPKPTCLDGARSFGEQLQRHLSGSPQSYIRPSKACKLWLSIVTADPVLVLRVEPCSRTCTTLPKISISQKTFYPVYPTDVGYLCFQVALCLSSQAMWISKHWWDKCLTKSPRSLWARVTKLYQAHLVILVPLQHICQQKQWFGSVGVVYVSLCGMDWGTPPSIVQGLPASCPVSTEP